MKKTITDVFNFYINSSIHVSLAIVCLAAITFLNFQIPVDYNLLLFIFLSAITAYNFVKYAGIAKLQHRTLAKNLRIIQIFSLLAFMGLIISAFYQPLPVLIVAFLMSIFTILYALPVFSNSRNLRGLPGIKIFVIAFVVSGVTVIMPLILEGNLLSRNIIIEFLQRFAIAVVLILPFEIRDLKYDMAQLGTLPQKYGVRKTKVIGYFLLLFFVLAEFLKQNTSMKSVLTLIFVGIVVLLFLNKSTINQGKYYSSFWVEAIPGMWLAFLLILQYII